MFLAAERFSQDTQQSNKDKVDASHVTSSVLHRNIRHLLVKLWRL
jgi:hypothetical protein